MSHWPYPKIVAHRGGGKLAPENTLAAIDTGAHYGHRMIEFDAKLSRMVRFFCYMTTRWSAPAIPGELLASMTGRPLAMLMPAVGLAPSLPKNRYRCCPRWRNAVASTI